MLIKPKSRIKKREFKRIRVNNRIRSTLKNSLARIALSAPDPERRKEAAKNLREGNPQEVSLLLKQALLNEKSEDVRKSVRFSLATLQLKHPDPEIRRESLSLLSGSLEPEVKNLLITALEKNSDGTWIESEADIRERIAKELAKANCQN